nr:MAG TPA: hypothetical protein [Bacteriophage sp.]
MTINHKNYYTIIYYVLLYSTSKYTHALKSN